MRTRSLAFSPDDLAMEAELVLPDSDDARAIVVLCHGIPSGSPPDPADPGYAGLARTLAAAGFGAVWFNFRGCRGAPGEFSARGWAADLHAVLDALRDQPAHGGIPIAVVGSSMGGATAIAVVAERPEVAALATLAAPAAVTSIVEDPAAFLHHARNVGIIRDPAFPADVSEWASGFAELAAVRHVTGIAPRPLLLVHGDADPTVPYEHAEQLFAVAGPPKELVRIEHGAHQLRRDPRAVDAVLDWLQRRLGLQMSGFVRDARP